jgi:hypothetical protein
MGPGSRSLWTTLRVARGSLVRDDLRFDFQTACFRHSGAMRSIEPGINFAVVVVPWIPGLRLSAHPGMTKAPEALPFSHAFAFPQA